MLLKPNEIMAQQVNFEWINSEVNMKKHAQKLPYNLKIYDMYIVQSIFRKKTESKMLLSSIQKIWTLRHC